VFTKYSRSEHRSGSAWIYSAGLHGIGIAGMLLLGGAIREAPSVTNSVSLIFAPHRAEPEAKPLAPTPRKLRALIAPVRSVPSRAVVEPKPVLIEAPVIQANVLPAAGAMPALQVPSPPPQIKAGMLEPASQRTIPAARPVAVQPAGFDDGMLKSRIEPNRAALVSVRSAGFGGESTTDAHYESKRAVSTGSFEGGQASPVATPSSARVFASTGSFGSAAVVQSRTGAQQQMAQAKFGDIAAVSKPEAWRRTALQIADSTAVEITFKPRPDYTPEARKLQIEGEVVVQANFKASGEIEVMRIIRGLGHGLDESAVAAVRSIQFRPAKRDGSPMDAIATVRMTFALAY
jgi:TonB family protein